MIRILSNLSIDYKIIAFKDYFNIDLTYSLRISSDAPYLLDFPRGERGRPLNPYIGVGFSDPREPSIPFLNTSFDPGPPRKVQALISRGNYVFIINFSFRLEVLRKTYIVVFTSVCTI